MMKEAKKINKSCLKHGGQTETYYIIVWSFFIKAVK